MTITNGIVSNSQVSFQLYHASGSTMVESIPVNGLYALASGMNYLRVIDNGNSFAAGDISYNINISPAFFATTASYTISLDNMLGSTSHYDSFPSQTYDYYDENENRIIETRYALTDGCDLTWTATYLSPSGFAATDVTDVLSILIVDNAWSNPQLITRSATSPNSNGSTRSVTIEAQPAFGQIHKAVGTYGESWYDYSCTLQMTSAQFGSFFSGSASVPIYITSKIWS